MQYTPGCESRGWFIVKFCHVFKFTIYVFLCDSRPCGPCFFHSPGNHSHGALHPIHGFALCAAPINPATCTTASFCHSCCTVFEYALGHDILSDVGCGTPIACQRDGYNYRFSANNAHSLSLTADCENPYRCIRKGCDFISSPALEHNRGRTVIVKPATATEVGARAVPCTRVNCNFVRYEEIPATG